MGKFMFHTISTPSEYATDFLKLSANSVLLANTASDPRGSGVGRLVAGAVSDYIGRFNTMILTLIWSLLVVFGLWLAVHPDRTWLFYIFAPLFGFGSGSIISMAPVCIGQYVLPHIPFVFLFQH